MADNSVQGGTDTIRDLARQSGTVKTQVVQIDAGGSTGNAEVLITAGQQAMAASLPVVLASDQTAVPVKATYQTRSDTYTAAASGTTVSVATTPLSSYSVQVTGTGAAASAWDVRLEGSLDNVVFTQILQHLNTTGDGVLLFTGANLFPALYVRSRCASITLGSATNIVVRILGVQ